MSRTALGTCVLALVPLAAAPAAPLPKDTRPVISPETVGRLKPVGETAHDVYRLVWGPKGGEVAVLSFSQPADVLDDRTLKPIRQLGAGRPLIHMAVARDRETVAWCENNSRVEVHDLKTGKAVVTIETGQSQPSVAFSPDGKLLATGGYGKEAALWRCRPGSRSGPWTPAGRAG